MSETLTTLGWIIVGCAGYCVVAIVLNRLFPRRCPECSTGILEKVGGCKSSGGKRSDRIASGYSLWKCKQCSRAFVEYTGKLVLLQTDDYHEEADKLVFGQSFVKESRSND